MLNAALSNDSTLSITIVRNRHWMERMRALSMYPHLTLTKIDCGFSTKGTTDIIVNCT